MKTNNNLWGNLLQSQQPTWASKKVRDLADALNRVNTKGNLSLSTRNTKNVGVLPDEGFGDPLYTDRNIRCYGSDIYFFDAIDDESQLILQQMLKQCVAQFLGEHITEILTQTLTDTITIHLNSPGGYAYCGLALYDFIRTLNVPISCVVEGTCASAATLILLACGERKMSDNSVFLMHQCSWGAWGDNRYMQDEAENSRKLMSRLRSIYMEETDIGKEYEDPKEREAYVQSILEHDRYFSKEECKQLGILKSDEDDAPALSEESMTKLNEFAQKLFEEEQAAKAKEEAKAEKAEKAAAKKAAPKKATPKKAPAKKEASPKKPVKAKPIVAPATPKEK